MMRYWHRLLPAVVLFALWLMGPLAAVAAEDVPTVLAHIGKDETVTVDDVERFGQQLAAGFVESQLSADSVEQWRAELLFEFGERHAGGRLRHGNRFCSAGNVPMIGDGSEDFQLA